MESILIPQRSAVYAIATALIFIVIMAMFWFMMTQILGPVQALCRSIAFTFGGTNTTYIAVDQFFTVIIMFFLALSIFGLALWVMMYSQQRGEVMM